MATEDIKIQDGRITVERVGEKPNVDVAVSDVESVTFTRSVWNGPGALVLHTANGDEVIRVENEDASEALALLRENKVGQTATEMPAEQNDVPASTEDNDPNVETQAQPVRRSRK
jgi:hypothetical protein